MGISQEAIEYAEERVKALAVVNFARPTAERTEALKVVWEFMGIEDVETFYSRIDDLTPEQGPFLHGVLFGLFLRQYEEL